MWYCTFAGFLSFARFWCLPDCGACAGLGYTFAGLCGQHYISSFLIYSLFCDYDAIGHPLPHLVSNVFYTCMLFYMLFSLLLVIFVLFVYTLITYLRIVFVFFVVCFFLHCRCYWLFLPVPSQPVSHPPVCTHQLFYAHKSWQYQRNVNNVIFKIILRKTDLKLAPADTGLLQSSAA